MVVIRDMDFIYPEGYGETLESGEEGEYYYERVIQRILKKEGYEVVFMATGTPSPRILTIESEIPEFKQIIQKLVDGNKSQVIEFGINLLYKVDRGDTPLDLY